jgi:hypothetical protein
MSRTEERFSSSSSTYFRQERQAVAPFSEFKIRRALLWLPDFLVARDNQDSTNGDALLKRLERRFPDGRYSSSRRRCAAKLQIAG